MPTRAIIQDVSTGDVIYPFSGSNLQPETVPNSALQSDVTLQGNTFNDANELVQLEPDGKLPALDGSNLTGLISEPTGVAGGDLAGDFPNPTIPRLPTSTNSGTTTSVWIAIRTDGKPGTGTEADPFDGSTQVKFDTLMASFGTYTTIHLLPGTYNTLGWGSEFFDSGGPNDGSGTAGSSGNGTDGWTLKAGQKLIGSGRGITTIQLSGFWSPANTNYRYIVVSTARNTNRDDVEVRDLTVNGNATNLNMSGYDRDGCIEAVFIGGSNGTISNVGATQCYGIVDSFAGKESFSLNVGLESTTPITNALIENCATYNHVGDYVEGVCFQNHGAASGSISGSIRNNFVDSTCRFGTNLAAVSGVNVVGNVYDGCSYGVHADFNQNEYISVIGNNFNVVNNALIVNPLTTGNYSNWVFSANTIITSGNSGAAIYLTGDGTHNGPFPNFTISGNSHNGIGASNVFFKLDNGTFHQVWVVGNISNCPNSITSADTSVKIGNNFLSASYSPDSAVPLLATTNTFTNRQNITVGTGIEALVLRQTATGDNTTLALQDHTGNEVGNLFWDGTNNQLKFTSTGSNPIIFSTASHSNQLYLDGPSGNIYIGAGQLLVGTYPGDGVNSIQASGSIATVSAGGTFKVKSGTNAKAGTFTLSSGSATVANTSVTANSVIIVTVKTVSGTRIGDPDIVPTAGTGFQATGGSLDNSTYNYVILEVN